MDDEKISQLYKPISCAKHPLFLNRITNMISKESQIRTIQLEVELELLHPWRQNPHHPFFLLVSNRDLVQNPDFEFNIDNLNYNP